MGNNSSNFDSPALNDPQISSKVKVAATFNKQRASISEASKKEESLRDFIKERKRVSIESWDELSRSKSIPEKDDRENAVIEQNEEMVKLFPNNCFNKD